MSVRKSFDEELDDIRKEVIRSANLAKEAVDTAVRSLAEHDLDLANRVIEIENRMDLLTLMIEDMCLKITALQQPVAKDLRFIATMMKVSEIFERVADHSYKIAEYTIKIGNRPHIKPLIDVPRMKDTIKEMIDIDIEAMKKEDLTCLEELTNKDDFIDGLFEQIQNELISFMLRDPTKVEDAIRLLFVARYLERIGDLACNAGARIHYMVEGTRTLIK